MKRLAIELLLGLVAVEFLGGCTYIVWKGTEAGTGAIANQEKPGQGPVLRGVEEGARKTNEEMKKVDQAEKDLLNKAKEAVTK